MLDVSSVARHDQTVVLLVDNLRDLRHIRIDTFLLLDFPAILLVNLNHRHVVFLLRVVLAFLEFLACEVLTSNEDHELSIELVGAYIHAYRQVF